jgi:putative tryptophan/tyrosine transport system substrate-binding protein
MSWSVGDVRFRGITGHRTAHVESAENDPIATSPLGDLCLDLMSRPFRYASLIRYDALSLPGTYMRRREFITLVSGAAVAWPLGTGAQEAGRTYRLGGLSAGPRGAPYFVAMFEELRRLGFVEGQNLTVYWHSFALQVDRLSDFAAALVKADVDAILASGDLATRAAQAATQSVPILGTSDDMVRSRLVQSLARPESNTTGISMFSTELDGKRQEILIEAVPGLRRMAALADSATTASRQLQALQDAARTRNVELSIQQIARPEDIAAAIEAAKAWGAAALNVLASPVLFGNRQIVLERVAALHLPAIYQFPEVAQDGGCFAYGPRLIRIFGELVTRQLVKLLRGTKPADVPVEQPSKFDLVINLKTANALGLTIPPMLLATADEVIE